MGFGGWVGGAGGGGDMLLLLLLLACEVEDGDVGALCHFHFADLPVHGFGGPPGEGHFFGDFFPHVLFKSAVGG